MSTQQRGLPANRAADQLAEERLRIAKNRPEVV
jgi:hypothetical protein